ncbi:hypothetical protein CMI41_02290 [Candidatus Pacearchaeota archaeon]|nr:hypothetical protein [Candidatus Pacearchaeota archaeon]|tara:strand:- start:1291 stop:1701 length:411 start_codon:yes stop_codon:yes gene_type:complete
MEEGGLISTRMREEHGKMIVLLNNFMKGDPDSLEPLKDAQGRHVFAEEKAIMVFYKNKKDFKLLSTILEQHKELRGYLDKIELDKKAAAKFEKLMKQHIGLEDSKFYPMLDKELNSKEQEEMFKEFMVLFNQKIDF